MNQCPSCGGKITYLGLTSLECETVGCCNGPKKYEGWSFDRDGWSFRHWRIPGADLEAGLKMWKHQNGARVVTSHKEAPHYYCYFASTKSIIDPYDGTSTDLEEAKLLAVAGQP